VHQRSDENAEEKPGEMVGKGGVQTNDGPLQYSAVVFWGNSGANPSIQCGSTKYGKTALTTYKGGPSFAGDPLLYKLAVIVQHQKAVSIDSRQYL
jgi:hypothetical protein